MQYLRVGGAVFGFRRFGESGVQAVGDTQREPNHDGILMVE
jgi:hypothetical protein